MRTELKFFSPRNFSKKSVLVFIYLIFWFVFALFIYFSWERTVKIQEQWKKIHQSNQERSLMVHSISIERESQSLFEWAKKASVGLLKEKKSCFVAYGDYFNLLGFLKSLSQHNHTSFIKKVSLGFSDLDHEAQRLSLNFCFEPQL